MTERRHKNAEWQLNQAGRGEGGDEYSYDLIHTAILMDIRDELQTLNRLLNRPNFISIPGSLRAIQKNTTKKRKKKRHD